MSRFLSIGTILKSTLLIAGLIISLTGASMSATTSNERKMLEAAASGDVSTIQRLLKDGVPVDVHNDHRQTALLVATHNNQIEAAKVLIEAGADVNAKDMIQDSPYLYAGARGHLEILKMTLANGADLKSTNRFGGTALIPASERGHVETVRTLIKAGVDVDHINRLGWTALIEAVILSDGGPAYVEIVKFLKDAGADLSIKDNDGVTALEHAKKRGFIDIVAVLEQ